MNFLSKSGIKNKKVILRCDFNVPMKNGKVVDDSRIRKSLKTINYLLENNCSIIILSHLGRIKTKEDFKENSLKDVSIVLEKLLNQHVEFIDNPVGKKVLEACKKMKSGEIILLENTRFCDVPEKLESSNNIELSKYFASLADAFVNDAFATLHRCHASVCGISKFLPTYFGFLVEEEINGLNPIINIKERPFVVFMGGAKIDDKIEYLKLLIQRCDYILLGGVVANSFLYALGYDVMDSICTNDELTLGEIRNIYSTYKDKIILPVDFLIDNNMILDFKDKSVKKYIEYFKAAKTIFINGTCGKFENEKYEYGTKSLFSALKYIDAIKIAGGGDTVNAINKFDLKDCFSFVSSGGGASLEYVSKSELSAINYINNTKNDTNIQ